MKFLISSTIDRAKRVRRECSLGVSGVGRTLCALVFALVLFADGGMILIQSVDRETAKVGDVVTASGTTLDQSNVAEMYLTDGKTDIKAEIVNQTATTIKFKVPQVPAGRYALEISTQERTPRLLEMPVKITIE